jgi:exosome complex RNA-binding protein Rrp42 (RNase PH superfamily)
MQSSIKGKISFQSLSFQPLNKCSIYSKIAVADPTAIEERVAEASLVFGINSYRELCGLHLVGMTLTSADLLLRSTTTIPQ